MQVKTPDALKAGLPPDAWGKILTATPVVMAVVATMLAGLASSEMTRAQYDRSLAAQQQSKAGDQWSFFQAKRLRGSLQRSTLDIMQTLAVVHPLEARDIGGATAEAQAALLTGTTPELPPAPVFEKNLNAALAALEAGKPETEILPPLTAVTDKTLADALRASRQRAAAFDVALGPVNREVAQLEKSRADATPDLARSLTAARLRFAANRYDAEARLNQAIANLYELQVRKSNVSAERHHVRSQRFFYGMLAAQLAVIISTFSLAARKHSVLWSLAAAAGTAAVLFAVYVYLWV